MKIDLNYLNRFGKMNIDSDFVIDEDYYKNTDIRKLKNLHVSGEVSVDYDDYINLNVKITGRMILPCAITLNDVPYDFTSEIEENIGKFEEIYKNNKNLLEISPILWENIVSEVPIRVVKDEYKNFKQSGNGWEVISD